MSEDWRKSIRKVVKVQHDWRSTIRQEPKVINGKNGLNGKDGKNGIDGRHGLDGKDGKDGKHGKDGKNANQIHYFDTLPSDDHGLDSDFAIIKEDKSLYLKENGKWVHKFHLSVKSAQAPFAVGGVSQNYVDSAIAAAIAGGGSSAPVIQEVTTDTTVTNQDVIICTSTGGYTITLKSLATATKPVVIKNFTDSTVNVVVSGGSNIDDEPTFVLEYRNGFTFNPLTSRYYVTG